MFSTVILYKYQYNKRINSSYSKLVNDLWKVFVLTEKMGMVQGKTKTSDKKDNNNTRIKFDPAIPEPEISDSEIKVLKGLWSTLKEDISKVGIITFVK